MSRATGGTSHGMSHATGGTSPGMSSGTITNGSDMYVCVCVCVGLSASEFSYASISPPLYTLPSCSGTPRATGGYGSEGNQYIEQIYLVSIQFYYGICYLITLTNNQVTPSILCERA